MKTKLLIFASAILMAMNLQAQAPEKFNYQGIARDNTGAPLDNQNIGIQISILNPSNTALYVEQHTETTNDFGLYTLQIGDGTPVSGTMAGVNWAGGTKKIKVEIDPNGGTSYTDLGTTELLSVPYALYAAEAPGGALWTQSGTDISFTGGNVGIGEPNPNNNLEITGDVSSDGRFVNLAPTNVSSTDDIIQMEVSPSSASGYQFIEANNGTENVFILQDDGSIENAGDIDSEGSVEALDFVSEPSALNQPGLVLNEFGNSNKWDLQYAATDNLWFSHNDALSSWIQPDGTYSTSDRRLKKNIVPVESVLEKVEKIAVMHYSMKTDKNNKIVIGYIAQDLLNQFPEVVDRAGKNEEGINYYGVNYGAMSAVAIKAIQEQQKIIEGLKATIKKMQARLDQLEQQ